MTKKEVKDFMLKIKSYYQYFSTEEYVINEWVDKLKDYDVADVYKKLEYHLQGEYKNDYPKLHFITMNLKTVKDKSLNQKISIQCSVCNAYVQEEEYEDHYERCNRIRYLRKQEEKGLVKINSDLEHMTLEQVNEVYYKVLNHIKSKITDDGYYGGQANSIKKVLETI